MSEQASPVQKPIRVKAVQLYAGMRLNHFTLIQRVKDNIRTTTPILRKRWRVECVCKKRLTLPEYYLIRKNPKKSCGCQNQGLPTKFKQEYHIWQMMRRRCNDPNHVSYSDYGGRGISVSPLWDCPDGFEAFLNEVGSRPSPRHTIDRIDNDGNYEPGNVKWSTAKEQRANQRPRKPKTVQP